jgi:hypothetical protein
MFRTNPATTTTKKNLTSDHKTLDPSSELQSLVNKLGEHVAKGQEDHAKDLLKKNPDLLLYKCKSVTDYSYRTFENITPFQLALWYMDTFMLRMLIKYLPREAQIEQAREYREWENKGGVKYQQHEHAILENPLQDRCEKHYNFDELIDKLIDWHITAGEYLQKPDATNFDRSDAARTRVGLAQRSVPAHVAHEYCNPFRSFDPELDIESLIFRPFGRFAPPLPGSIRSLQTNIYTEDGWSTTTFKKNANGIMLGMLAHTLDLITPGPIPFVHCWYPLNAGDQSRYTFTNKKTDYESTFLSNYSLGNKRNANGYQGVVYTRGAYSEKMRSNQKTDTATSILYNTKTLTKDLLVDIKQNIDAVRKLRDIRQKQVKELMDDLLVPTLVSTAAQIEKPVLKL